MRNKWINEAREIAAQCWCDAETSSIEMDARLAEAMARRLAAWMETASEQAQRAEFYLGLLHETASHLDARVRMADDGSMMDAPLLLKIPELVAELANERAELPNYK